MTKFNDGVSDMLLEQVIRRNREFAQRIKEQEEQEKRRKKELTMEATSSAIITNNQEIKTQTLGVHNCPSSLVAQINAIAKDRTQKQGRRVTSAQVVIDLLQKAIKAEL